MSDRGKPMNLHTLGAALLVATAGAVAYAANPETPIGAALSGKDAGAATLRLVVESQGEAHDAVLVLKDADGGEVGRETLRVPRAGTVARDLAVAVGTYVLGLEAASGAGLGGAYAGAARVDLAACDPPEATVTMIVSLSPAGESGIEVQRALCANGDFAGPEPPAGPHVATSTGTYRHRVAAATPLTPHARTVPLLGGGCLGFAVKAGAERLEVVASWTPASPSSEEMRVDLYGASGASSLAHDAGPGPLTLALESPAPGDYCVLPWAAGPVGAAFDQSVSFVMSVAYP